MLAQLFGMPLPMAPEGDQDQIEPWFSPDIARQDPAHMDNMRAKIKARFPGLNESDLDELMM